MSGYLEKISGKIPNTYHDVDIQLNGKNLIITGGNGSGKTSFLKALHDKLLILIKDKQLADYKKLQDSLVRSKSNLATKTKGTTDYIYAENWLKSNTQKIKKIEQGLQLEIPKYIEYSLNYDNEKSIIRFFTAQRQAQITPSQGASGLTHKPNTQQIENIGQKLEQHLVNLRTRSSFAITEDKNQQLHDKIIQWFNGFKQDLQFLMEDETTQLIFKPQEFKFYIDQEGKKSYTFQTLSSGYSAIFDVLADLLIRAEFFEISPKELTGIVLIDEIDAHLHVSLQRKILPFLTRSFPKLQFIVTTHSPFVITSINNAVIYDLKKKEQIDDDLSMYSYEAILEGLLDVPPISQELETEIADLSKLMEQGKSKTKEIKAIVDKIRPYEDHLDDESQMFYQKAIYFLLSLKRAA